MKKTLASLLTTVTFSLCANETLHHKIPQGSPLKNNYIWQENSIEYFDELIVSWDAQRPQQGNYTLAISLFTDDWSPWLDYIFWGQSDQYSFDERDPQGIFRTYQDAAEVLNGKKASGFKVRLTANEGASLENFRALHACATDLQKHHVSEGDGIDLFIDLQVPGRSQVALPDERNMRLCSPTSTTAVINYLSPSLNIDPLTFADTIRDSAFDIYGNWILNTAQASHHLKGGWSCYVARLMSFDQILGFLQKGTPVVVSIKGPIKGGADLYESGHLIVVKGFDPQEKRVLCMDPAFGEDTLTLTSYALEDFLTAWRRRHGTAYLIHKSS